MRKIPTSVIVLSIIGILLGALGLLGFCLTAVMTFGGINMGQPNPAMEGLTHDTLYKVFTAFALLVGLPLAALEIVASIASLQLKAWARKGMILFAWLSLGQLVLGTIFNVAYVFPKMYAAANAAVGAPPGTREGMIGGMVGGACGLILTPIFPICILYFFRRRHVIDAFNGIFPAEPTAFPIQPDEQQRH